MLSKRLDKISPSCTIGISSKVKEMKKSGVDVINLSIGEPDFNVPREAIEYVPKLMQWILIKAP